MLDEGSVHAVLPWPRTITLRDVEVWSDNDGDLNDDYARPREAQVIEIVSIGTEIEPLQLDTQLWTDPIAAARRVEAGNLTGRFNRG